MKDFAKYSIKAADWRKQIRENERRTKVVILLFVLIYLGIGFLIDLVLQTSHGYQQGYQIVHLTLSQAAYGLVTLKLFPIATVIAGIVAVLSLLITYSLHNKIMLMGTEYREITPENARTMEEKQLYNVVEEMKVAAGMSYMPKVYIIEANYMNAFASGFSEKSAMVAITRGLMTKLDRSELQAVMAHELSHIRHHDIKLTLTASVLSNLTLIAIDILFWNVIFSRNNDRGGNRLMVIIVLLRYLLPLITILLMMYLSRTREYMADAGSVELIRDNEPMARALMKIHQDYQANADAYASDYRRTAHEEVRRASYIYDPSQAGLRGADLSSAFSTHPSLKQRLQALGFEQQQ
ncbi:MAG: zinc metalloprotease HtpX [Legionellales bacterium]|nr:zinc metalloprotease HtpX [Legionellales bacterium]|tara:strand:- start:44375 stop:45427 length:1053 start_codon:yes stop_codon:yes gene_type:complete